MMPYLVLLKDGQFLIVQCGAREIFDVARERDAGICGVFEERELAEALVTREQSRVAQ